MPEGSVIPKRWGATLGKRSPRVAPISRLLLGTVVAATALLTSCSKDFTPLQHPVPITEQGDSMASLWVLFFWIAVAVMVIVYALFFISAIRDRAKKGDDELPKQFSDNSPLELTFVVIPLVIVIGLFIVGILVSWDVDNTSTDREPDLTVVVTAFDWNWQFQYTDADVTVVGSTSNPAELHLPVGKVIELHIRSADVDHSFFVPAFLYKLDAIPGIENKFQITIEPDKTGRYHGQCAEFCGLFHSLMEFELVAEPESTFQQWLDSQPKGTDVADTVSATQQESQENP